MTDFTKAVAYTRFSVAAHEDQASNSHERQLETARAYIERMGWLYAGSYSDDVSGTKDVADRPALSQLLEDAKSGAFSVVVAARLDRIARSVRLSLNLLHELQELGVAVVSVAEGIDTSTPAGRMARTMMMSFAELDREQIVARTVSGSRSLARKGILPGGSAPLGYAREGNQIVPNPAERDLIWAAAKAVLDGASTGEAAGVLNALGYTSRRSTAPWTHARVRRMLEAPSLKGVVVYGNVKRRHGHNTKLSRDGTPLHGEPITVLLPDPVMDEATWDRLQATLLARGYGKKRDALPYPLSAFSRCHCGEPLAGVASRDRRTYRCRGARWRAPGDNTQRCTQPRLGAIELEAQVWGAIAKQLSSFRLIQRAVKRRMTELGVKDSTGAERELARTRKAIADSESGIGEMVKVMARSGQTADAIEQAITELQADVVALRVREAKLAAAAVPAITTDDTALALLVRFSGALNHKRVPDPKTLERILIATKAEIKLAGPSERGAAPELVIDLDITVDAILELAAALGLDSAELSAGEKAGRKPWKRSRLAWVPLGGGIYSQTSLSADTDEEYQAELKELGAVEFLPDDGVEADQEGDRDDEGDESGGVRPVEPRPGGSGGSGGVRVRVPGGEGDRRARRLTTPDLSHHHAIGSHPQRLAHQVTQTHVPGTLHIGWSGLQVHHVRMLWLQLAGILHDDEALVCTDE